MLLPRMEQAAIDVLFNKAVWRNSSTTRRTAWHPPLWTESRDMSKLVGIRGREWRINSYLMDGFLRYPLDRQTKFATTSPSWWAKVAEGEEDEPPTARDPAETISFLASRGTLRVIDAEDVAE